MPYSDMFKRKMVQRMSGPETISASALAKQVDVPGRRRFPNGCGWPGRRPLMYFPMTRIDPRR